MSGAGGLSRRRQERPRRSTYIKPKLWNAARYHRKTRKGWAAHM